MATRNEALRNRHFSINNVLRTFGWSLSALVLAASGKAPNPSQFTADLSIPAQVQSDQTFLLRENRPAKINLGNSTVEVNYKGITDLNCTFEVNEEGRKVPQTLKVVADNMTSTSDGQVSLSCNPEFHDGQTEGIVNTQAKITQD